MTRLAFAGNIGDFGASGSTAAATGVSSASISCNIPGSSIEALASERMAVRREGLNDLDIWFSSRQSINMNSFVANSARTNSSSAFCLDSAKLAPWVAYESDAFLKKPVLR